MIGHVNKEILISVAQNTINFSYLAITQNVTQLFETQRHKPEVRGIDFRWGNLEFLLA
jgi:hypothetical protein